MKNYDDPINKSYFTASEVAEMIGESAGVVRHWNEVFELGAHMGRQHRLYTPEIVIRLRAIQTLLRVDKYTIEGAKQKLGYREPVPLDQERLNQIILKEYKIDSLQTKSRKMFYVHARFSFAFMARKYIGLTLQEIANILDLDHTTVMYGINHCTDLRENYKPFAYRLNRIEDSFLKVMNPKTLSK